MPRSVIVSTLPREEHEPVASEFRDADFELISVHRSDELEAVLLDRSDVSMAIIDGESDFDASLEHLSLVRSVGRDIPTLMVLSPHAFDRLGSEEHAGIEYFTRPYSAESLRWRAEAMLIRANTFDDGSGPILSGSADGVDWNRRAVIIAVFNPKGGVGKTTVATNLATVLQTRRDQKVLLIDADTVTGHIASSLGLDRVESVADVWESGEQRPGGLAALAAPHSNGLKVVVLATSPLQTERIDPTRFSEALAGTKLGFDVVVIDLHPDYGPLNRAIFGRCNRILVPVTPDVPAIRAAMQFHELSGDMGVRDRVAMIVNRANSGVSVADMETTTGMRAFGTVRSAGMQFVRAANEGLTAVEKFPKEKVTGDFEALADTLLSRPVAAPTSERRPILGLLNRNREVVRA
jgi:pilus assembly protein CpaE